MIVASAIKFYFEDDVEHKFPQILTGLRHADIFERMFTLGIKYDKESHVQGFITDDDTFFDRYMAMAYAYLEDQVGTEQFKNNCQLYSEDLWPEDE